MEIIGLGNPGKRYQNNRHNVGKMFIDSSQGDPLRTQGVTLLKTNVFMNDSGKFVAEKFNFFKVGLDDLYIVHDDLDLPLGQFKIQKGVGPKVHNGVKSVEEALGTKDFWRIRIGVDNRDPENRLPGEDYVLQDFKKEEFKILNKVFEEIAASPDVTSGSSQ